MAFDKSGKYNFKSLEGKYSKFLSPTFQIKVGGKKLDSAKVPISHLQVQLTTENKSGMCSFTVEAMYDYEKGVWSDGLLNTIDVGLLVVVEAGYADAQKLIFQGYVDKVRIEYTAQAAPRLHVSAIDGMGLLMSEREKVDFGKKDTKKVVEEMLAPCKTSSLVKTITVDTLPKFKRQLVKEAGCSTYDYLCQLAELCFMNFCIIGDTLLFSNLMKNTTPIMTLTMGQNLMEFTKTIAISSQMVSQVTVSSTGDTATQEEVRGTATTPSTYGGSKGQTAAQMWRALKGAERDMKLEFLTTAEECKAVAQNLLDTTSFGLVQGSGRCIGIPDLIPGRYIEVAGMDKNTNGSYFMTSVTHTFTEDGYFTEFEVKGFRG